MIKSVPCFDQHLSETGKHIIEEELSILQSMHKFIKPSTLSQVISRDNDMISLRDTIAESTTDDRAQLMSQLISVSQLAKQQTQATPVENPIHADTPYFGHLRLKQEGRIRELLIGSSNLFHNDLPMPIVNWYSAPISRVFYRYQEGDFFEEDFGGRLVEGQVLVHRRLVIEKGFLLRVECSQGRFQQGRDCWQEVKTQSHHLGGFSQGGVGISDRRLASISGLLDEDQYNLITDATSQVMVVDGGAGSGKTTVALHRLAFLAQHNPQRFTSKNMMVVVFSDAMASYLVHFLPALGRCRIEVYDRLVEGLRKRHFSHLPVKYHTTTTGIVWHFKQSSLCQKLLLATAQEKAAEWETDLAATLNQAPQAEELLAVWRKLAPDFIALRPLLFSQWLAGKYHKYPLPNLDHISKQRLQKALKTLQLLIAKPENFVLEVWSEAFLRLDQLQHKLHSLAPNAYTPQQVKELHQKLFSGYGTLADWLEWHSEELGSANYTIDKERIKTASPSKPMLYREDDTILLLLYQQLVGPLKEHHRDMKLAHITIDESQDFSPPELQLLLNLADQPLSLTLAGDTEQRIILQQQPRGWTHILAEIGLDQHATIRRLEVGYRGSKPIISFARSVLGHLHQGHPWRAIRGGPPVVLLQSHDNGPIISFLTQKLKELHQTEPNATIALIARQPQEAQSHYQALLNAEVPNLKLVLDHNFSFKPKVEVTLVSQVKGLEFDYVIVLNVNQQNWQLDDTSRTLLHVAATRASHQLWLTCAGKPSLLLPKDILTQSC